MLKQRANHLEIQSLDPNIHYGEFFFLFFLSKFTNLLHFWSQIVDYYHALKKCVPKHAPDANENYILCRKQQEE